MGAVMAIKHLAGKAETCDQALKLFSTSILYNLKKLYIHTRTQYIKSQIWIHDKV